MSEKKIKILKPFSDSYTLYIESLTKAISLDSYSKVRIRWNFAVLEIQDDGIICNLIKTEQTLIETNNPIVQEIQQVSAVFGRMYSDVKVKLNHEGKVLEVLNMNTILSKWNDTKAEMKKHIDGNPDLENSISLNDEIFNDPEKIKIAVQAQEFFTIYFSHFFGEKIPIINRVITAPNLFSTAYLQWVYNIDGGIRKDNQTNVIIKTKGKNKGSSLGFNNKAYAQFKEHLNIANIMPDISEEAEHVYRLENGKLERAHIIKKELVEEDKLTIRFDYTMTADSCSFKEEKSTFMISENS